MRSSCLRWLPVRLGPIVAALLPLALCAQDLVNPQVTAPSTGELQPQTTEEAGTSTTERPTGSETNLQQAATPLQNEISSEPRRFQYGLNLTVRGVYDDNINISSTNKISDYYIAIEPSITLGFGDITGQLDNFIRFDYAPSGIVFIDHSENNAIQHFLNLAGQHRFGHLNVTLQQSAAILDGTDIRTTVDPTSPGGHVNIDVGGRIRQDIYNSQLGWSYDLSGKTFLSGAFGAQINEYPGSTLFGSKNLNGNLFINYIYSDKLTFGLGGTGGYNLVEDNTSDQTYEQANARLAYRITGKIDMHLSGGIEFRQFGNDSRGEYISPVYEVGFNYQPYDGTTLTLSGNRRTQNSAVFVGQDYSQTNINAGIRQRFFGRLFVGVNGGYENADYFSVINGVSANRRDDYFYAQPSLDLRVTRFWTVGAYYLHRQNDSTLNSFEFRDNQTGFRTSFTF